MLPECMESRFAVYLGKHRKVDKLVSKAINVNIAISSVIDFWLNAYAVLKSIRFNYLML